MAKETTAAGRRPWARTIPAAGGASDDPKRMRDRARHFFSLIKTATPIPRKAWREAREAYAGKADDPLPPRANLFRTKIDTQAAFLDQQPATVHFQAKGAHADNPRVAGAAECDEELYQYIFEEQDFAKEIRDARHDADLVNLGVIWHRWDHKRGLPTIQRLPPEHVRFDGLSSRLEDAGWVAVCEYESAELLARETGRPLSELAKAAESARQSQRAETDDGETEAVGNVDFDRERAMADVKDTVARCRVWHLYLRNEYALYDTDPRPEDSGPEGKPQWSRFRDRFAMNEPRRYVRLVEGLDEPLDDVPDWPAPYLLDYGEWPVTILQYNRSHDTIYGFTDYQHEKRILADHETALTDLHTRAALRNPPKFLATSGCGYDEHQVAQMMSSDRVQVFMNALTPDGKPLIVPVDYGTIERQDLEYIEHVQQTYDRISMIPEIMRSGEPDSVGNETATSISTRIDSATAKLERRMREYERFQLQIARKTMQMAHKVLPRWTTVEYIDPNGQVVGRDETGMEIYGPALVEEEGPWESVSQKLALMDGEIECLGVEAIVGPDLAAYWSGNQPIDVLLREIHVGVEHGSTQRRQKIERAHQFRQVLSELIMPLVQQTGDFQAYRDAVEKVLELMDLEDFSHLVPRIPEVELPPEPVGAVEGMEAAHAAV